MSDEYYRLYQKFEQAELFDVLLNPDNYLPDAVACAKQVAREKGWWADYQKLLALKKEEQAHAREEEELEDAERAEYYRRAVEFRNANYCVNVLLQDSDRFQDRLNELGIEYFKDDGKQQLYSQPFYFRPQDMLAADEVRKQMPVLEEENDDDTYTGRKEPSIIKWMVFIALFILGYCALAYIFK